MTVHWDFNPVPYCQPDSPTPMEYALPPSLEWHVWPGRRSIYNIKIGQNTEKCPGDFLRLAVTQTHLKNYQLTQVGKNKDL